MKRDLYELTRREFAKQEKPKPKRVQRPSLDKLPLLSNSAANRERARA